ncbi:MAG: TolC family protein [Aquaticitalea sp.]
MIKKGIFSLCLLCQFLCFSQDGQTVSYTLSECIDIAIKNNLDLKLSELRAKSSKVNYNQAWGNILPNLNGNYDVGINNGRSIDPFTNGYVNQKLTFSNAGLSLNATVFNGFKLMNTIKQNRLSLKASEMEIEEAKQNLILDVTLGYIQIMNSKDKLELAKSRLVVTQNQVDRLGVLYKEEVGNPADYTDMKGQFASDTIAVISAENSLKEATLNLFQLMGLQETKNSNFESLDPSLELVQYAHNAEDVYNEALQNLATFKAKELRFQSAQMGVKAAKAEYVPEISFFGRLNTNYSSAAQVFTDNGSSIVETGDFVTIDNQNYTILSNQSQFTNDGISYKDQFNNNVSSVVGLSVNIPLFNGFRARNLVALQKIRRDESSIDLQNTKLLFHNAIEQAYINMEAAFKRYTVLEQQQEAFAESFRINEIRFNNGVSNIIEYITSKNNLDAARLNLSNAKYEYLLRQKILDYYRGL